MQLPQQRIKTSQDWNNFISANPVLNGNDLLIIRHICYAEIERLRKRPLIVYATRFLDSLPNTPNSIHKRNPLVTLLY